MPGPTHKGQQPNSNKDSRRQSRSNEKLPPPQRSRAREDIGTVAVNDDDLLAQNLYLFSTRLAAAAAWRRGELPSTFPFGLCLWLIIALIGGAIAV